MFGDLQEGYQPTEINTMQAGQVLDRLLRKMCPDMHKLRRTALFVNVMAALHGAVLTVTHLGRAISSDAKEKHCIKRADRLLSNRRLQRERLEVYTALAGQLIGKQRPVLLVDWSDMDECKRISYCGPRSRWRVGADRVRRGAYPENQAEAQDPLAVSADLAEDAAAGLSSHRGLRCEVSHAVVQGSRGLGLGLGGADPQSPSGATCGEAAWIPCKCLYDTSSAWPGTLDREQSYHLSIGAVQGQTQGPRPSEPLSPDFSPVVWKQQRFPFTRLTSFGVRTEAVNLRRCRLMFTIDTFNLG
jgi:hypothetical protein